MNHGPRKYAIMSSVRKSAFILPILVVAALCCAGAEDEGYAYDRWSVGASGGVMLPGNGNALRRAAAVSLRGGYYATETFALEVEAASVPRATAKGMGGASLTGVSAGGLLHLTAFDFYDRLFGSERFDPFVTFGAHAAFASKHVFADCSHRSAFGPAAGIGAFYHLTERLSVRAEARAALCCDSPCGMLYGVFAGFQYSFGADE